MSNVLLIHEDRQNALLAEQVLTTINIFPVSLALHEFQAEFLLSGMFDLIIFELSGVNRSCVTILRQLESLATTSGLKLPPVIVVTEQEAVSTEQALRTANVNFFFVKPVSASRLAAAIDQSLLLHRS